MRTIIAGGRECGSILPVERAMAACGWVPSVVLSGKAPGVDRLGEDWANARQIPVEPYPAKWRDEQGRKDPLAGFKRNALMAENAEALVAIWDGVSPGTKDMIERAQEKKLRVHIHLYDAAVFGKNKTLLRLQQIGVLP